MSELIGFNKLFDAGSFDNGTSKIVQYIKRITAEIKLAETAANGLATALGKQLQKDINALNSSSKTLAKDMQTMAQKMNDFKTTTTNTKKVISDYEKENERLRKELEKLKLAQTGVGKAAKDTGTSFKGTAQAMLGVASGAALVYSGIRTLKEQLVLAVKSTIAFEKAMKEVQAISRATDSELGSLTKNANKLGATTEKLAVDVANVQKEMAKLGLTASEIIVSTKAIVDLSTATGEDLVTSAVVATATLRAFGLGAEEMTRVVDVMAGSFVRSGLDLEKFRESMKLVAPIARAVNVDIETTTAMLSKLADAGLSGSLAGTALRNLISSMADPTEALAERIGGAVTNSDDLVKSFIKLKREGVDLAEAVQLVDVRARPAFFTLVNQAEAVEALSVEYKYLRDEASMIAKAMRDTLANDISIAESAFDSLRRNLVEEFTPAMRSTVQDITTMIESLRLLKRYLDEAGDSAGIDRLTNMKLSPEVLSNLNVNAIEDALSGSQERGLFTDWYNQFIGDLGEVVESGNFKDAITSVDVLLGDVAESMEVVDSKYSLFTQANTILQAGLEDTSEEVDVLRAKFPKLSEEVENNRHFLILLRKAQGDGIEKIRSYITSLEDQKKELEELRDQQKSSGDVLGNLEKTEEALLSVEGSLLILREKMLGITTDLTAINKEENDLLLEKLELTEKLMKLNGDFTKEQAKTAEMVAQNNFDEEEALKMKLPLLEKLTKAKLHSAQVTLKADLDAIKLLSSAEVSEPEKIVMRNIAYEKFTQAKINLDKEHLKQYEKVTDEIISIEDKAFMDVVEFYKFKDKQAKDSKTNQSKLQGDINKDAEAWASKGFDRDKHLAKVAELNLKKADDAELDALKAKEDKKLAIQEAAAEGLSRLATFMFDNRQAERELELQAIDSWQSEQTRLAGDNEDAKLRIEVQADRKRAVIRKKQAEDNKREAMFQIFIDTARAVMAVIAAKGSLGEGIAVGALGLASLAMVAARPVPQFAKGTGDSPEGYAEVGERGRELIKDGKTGKWSLTPDSSTVTYLTKHSQVITNAETERILSQDHNNKADNYLSSNVKQARSQQIDYSKIGQEVGKHISNIPINVTNFDQNGVTKYVMGRSSKITRLNKKY